MRAANGFSQRKQAVLQGEIGMALLPLNAIDLGF